ncbi:MAG: HEAT repeat domain-containing protein [Thermoguttaceae bacterium]
MNDIGSRRLPLVLCGLLALAVAGCADMDLPAWVPFQGPASDQLPGVPTPAERITELQTLGQTAASHSPQEKQEISDKLAHSMAKEADPLIRVEIIRALGGYPSPAADAILKAAMADPDVNVRLAACEAWGRRNDANAVELLSEALKGDVNSEVRLAAAKSLGDTRNPAAVAPLGEALDDSDPAMQYRAVQSLEKITGRSLGQNVGRWQEYVKNGQSAAPQSTAERVQSWF